MKDIFFQNFKPVSCFTLNLMDKSCSVNAMNGRRRGKRGLAPLSPELGVNRGECSTFSVTLRPLYPRDRIQVPNEQTVDWAPEVWR